MSKQTDYLETLAEEIRLSMNLDAKVESRKIIVPYIFGKIEYETMYDDVIMDLYRFCYFYGMKLHQYGLEYRIKHQSDKLK